MTRLTLVSIVLFGCSSLDDTYAADATLFEPARVAAEAWCFATEGAYCPVIAEASVGTIPLRASALDGQRCGYYGGASYGIRVDVEHEGFRCSSPETVIAHELGHAAGLGHFRECGYLMSAGPCRSWPDAPTEEDLAWLFDL